MAIVCDQCKVTIVNHNGEICQKCIDANELALIDTATLPRNKVYLEPEIFERFEKLHSQVLAEKNGSKKAFGKFMSELGTSFINKFTGKEINDPTPKVIIPQERTLDRIQKILNHNLANYARTNDLDTPEDLDDWTVADMVSDEWEQTLYQYVESVELMANDNPTGASDSVPESTATEAETSTQGPAAE